MMQAIRLVFLWASLCLGMSVANGQQDTSLVTYDTFIEQVLGNHPLAMAAGLQPEKGRAVVREARGAFDPKVQGVLSQKYFEEKQYYSLGDAQLKIPTWFGIEAEAGYGLTDGVFLNPQNNLPDAGLWYAGIKVPLAEGLIVDQRRTALRQAQVFRRATNVERTLLINELVLDASMAYYNWALAAQLRAIYADALANASERLEAVRSSAILGEVPLIDTLEASIQVQNRNLAFQQANLEWQNARLGASNFLWLDGNTPLEIDSLTQPLPINGFLLNDGAGYRWNDSLLQTQPNLQVALLKVENLELSQRQKRNELLPTIDLKYRPISSAAPEDFGLQPTNYTWGLSVSMPLFLRKERGALKLANLKLQEERLGLQQKNRDVQTKLAVAQQTWANSYDQALQYRQIVQDYRSLLQAEVQKFNAGESSLFLINSRELKYIEAQTKEAELSVKNRLAELKFDFVLGRLGQ